MKIIGKIPHTCYLALSGGKDSMVILDFLRRGKRNVTALYFNHGTPFGEESEQMLVKWTSENNIPLIIGRISSSPPKGVSKEDFWRQERYKFLDLHNDHPVITAHHLNDVAETWIFSSLHGAGKLIPYQRGNYLRPFLMVSKKEIDSWATRKEVQWVEDPSNTDTKYKRNFIRHILMPQALEVNPGLLTSMRKKLELEYK